MCSGLIASSHPIDFAIVNQYILNLERCLSITNYEHWLHNCYSEGCGLLTLSLVVGLATPFWKTKPRPVEVPTGVGVAVKDTFGV